MLIRKAQMMEPTGGIQGTLHNWSLPPIIDRSHFCNIGPGAGVTKLRSLISPQAKISILQKYLLKSLMAFILDRCHCSWAAATAVKYKCGIQLPTLEFKVLKNQENDGTEEINSVTPTQIKQDIRHSIYTRYSDKLWQAGWAVLAWALEVPRHFAIHGRSFRKTSCYP